MRIVSTLEMKEIEQRAFEKYHFSERLIIENVGMKGAQLLIDKVLSKINNLEVIFLIGKGSNGADGLAIARHLSSFGYRVRAFTFFEDANSSVEQQHQMKMASSFGVITNLIKDFEEIEAYFNHSSREILVVDALFGTGVQLPLSNFLYEVIHFINENSSYTVSIDMPSGVEGDSGFIQGNAIHADLTLGIALPKLGYYVAEGATLTGEIEILDVGLPYSLLMEEGDKYLLKLENLIDSAAKRNKFADKKTYGHTLILGGSHGLTGAVAMSATAALRVGSGLITAATWEPQYQEMIPRLIPEVMTGYIPMDTNKWGPLLKSLDKYAAIVIGPGLARSTRTRRLVLEVLQTYNGPVVLDADAINVMSMKEDAQVFSMRNAPTVLTPHLGEFSRFSGIPYEELIKKPVEYVKALVEEINCSVILKGPCSYLGFPDGKVYFNFFPNDGMATGGVGDVLSGILGGLLAQEAELKENSSLFNRYENFNRTVSLAVLVHSVAGKIASEKHGVRPMSAMSLIEAFTETFKDMDKEIDYLLGGEA